MPVANHCRDPRRPIGMLAVIALLASCSSALAADLLPMLKAGDENRRCFVAEAPGDIVFARLTAAELLKQGSPIAPLLFSLGRYVIDEESGGTAVIFGLSARSADGPFTLLTGGGCAGTDSGANCIGDCIGGSFDVDLSADARIATLRPLGGALQFIHTEGAAPGACRLSGGGQMAAYVVFRLSGETTMSFVEADPAACEPMIGPLLLQSVE